MFRKNTRLVLLLAVLLTTFTGCTKGKELSSSGETERPYTVNFVYHAPKEGNQAEVNALINELTMKELNMKVNLIPIGWDTYNTKFPAMLAAKEPMDISFVFAFSFASFLDAGYIVDASAYSEYTKDIYSMLGDDVNAGCIGNMLVGFPVMNVRSAPSAFFVRKDIFEALGYKESDFNVTTDDYSTFNQLTQLLGKIKEKYPDMIPFDGHRTMGLNNFSYVDGFGDYFGVLENYGQTTKVTNWYESEQIRQFARINREWFVRGYSSKDIAVAQEQGQIKMKTGNSATFFASYTYPGSQLAAVKSMTGYDVVMIPVSTKMKSTTTVNAVLMCVMQQSKNKAKAFQFLNWAYTSPEFNDYLNWGVPGKDWIVNKDGMADFPEGVNAQNVNYHEDFGFIYPNQYIGHQWVGNSKNVGDQVREFDSDALPSLAYGFTFDASEVANEEAQCSAVLAKYESDICFGVIDPDTALAALNKDLYAAGLQKIIDAKQKQLDAWLAKKR